MTEIRFTVTTDQSLTHTSVWIKYVEKEVDTFKEILGKFTSLNSFNLTTEDGVLMYFNPIHLTTVAIETR